MSQQEPIDLSTVDAALINSLQSPEHRLFVLSIEQNIEQLLLDPLRTNLQYSQMNSYQRLVIHRVADHYKMDHLPDAMRQGVNVYKTQLSTMPLVKLRDVPMPEMTSDMSDPQLKIIQRQSRPRNDHRKNDNYQHYQKFKSLEEREAAYQQARARIFQEGQEPEEEMRENEDQNRFTRVQPRISSNEPRPRFYYTNYYSPQPYGYPPYVNYSEKFPSEKPYFSNDGSFAATEDGPYPPEMVGSPVQPVMYLPYGYIPNPGILPFPADENGILYYPYPPPETPQETQPEPPTEPKVKSVIRFGTVETPIVRTNPPAFSTKSHFKPNNVIVSKTVEKNE